ncbi:MAG: propionate kinase [Geobacteraceae bacterium GWC2_55_20]|nr:MAG: propionate kinase [Geobacteraceae bacterium GWC2_55_20]OGU24702.1 MAG: propionate kinase [Geobacteraceae bacterium GWF2_54_21]HBA71865.1 propionate kinase [Geobacter sp.]HCE67066.1 propionate kinase [Geobacter sp.]
MKILTITCWSHKIKYHLFSGEERTLLASGMIERVGLGGSFIRQMVPGREPFQRETGDNDHKSAMAIIIATLADPKHGVITHSSEISAVGHRVAHGGEQFRHSVQLDEPVLDSIRKLQYLAPMHLAPNIAGIKSAMLHLPAIPHVAVFDTAFHSSMPECAYIYPLPYEWYENHGVRRYGFHGPSHLYLSRRAAAQLGKPATACNLITIHLDRGVSLCAIKNGLSVDTSMGMTPLEGAVMETRCGDIDPGIQVYMMNVMGLSAKELEQVLNNKSGILGIAGRQLERRHYLRAALAGDTLCALALKIETYRLRKYIGSFLAITGPLDAIVFSAGSGDLEWAVREMTLDGLGGLGIRLDQDRNRAIRSPQDELEITGTGSLIRTFVIPSNEELVIADDVAAIHSGTGC